MSTQEPVFKEEKKRWIFFEAAVEKLEMEQFGATTLIEFPVSYRKDGAGDGDRTRDVQLGKLAVDCK